MPSDARARLLRAFSVTFGATFLLGLVFLAGYLLGDHRTAQGASLSDLKLLSEVRSILQFEFLGDAPTPEKQAYGAARGLVQSYNDPYTVFVEPAPRTLERDDLRGHFGGIGANMGRNAAGDMELHPVRERPAARAGVQDGDILLAVDARPITAQMSVDEVVALVRGDEGSKVVLTLRHPGALDTFQAPIVRERIELPSVDWRMLDAGQHIGYVHISILGEQTSAELKTGISELASQGAERIVLDLRGDGGGLLDAAVDSASQFLTDGLVLREQEREGPEQTYPVKSVQGPAQSWQIAVLTDGGTASAAEIIAGALRDHGRAVLIGEKTYGKGSVQRVHEFDDGSSLHVTIARWLTPQGHAIDKVGLSPDVQVSLSDDDRKAGRDPQLARAAEWLASGH